MKPSSVLLRLLLSPILFATLLAGTLSASKDAEEAETLEFTATPEYRSGQYLIDLDAGQLNRNKKYRIKLTIHNATNNNLEFKGVKTSCSCFGADVSALKLDAGSDLLLEFTAPVEKQMKKPSAFWVVFLESSKPSGLEGIQVKVSYNIGGILTFKDARVVLDVDPEKKKNFFTLPLLVTAPVAAENLTTHVAESLGDIKVAIVKKDGSVYLELEVDETKMAGSQQSGEISCIDTLTGIETVCFCVMKRVLPVSVYPGILRARATSDIAFEVTALIRINSEKAEHDGKFDAIVDASFGGKTLRPQVQILSPGVLRVRLTIAKQNLGSLEQGQRLVHWNIKTKDGAYEVSSPIHFSQQSQGE
ncbi:hypothetical protein [Stieleria varia]|uniref:DUF1573 domain-containing protein n=1 Tax=Stieleria varia TaxID=2528005 RepID=A0A5C5ZPP3_9BACT|nr:hypothetical protein [Stieleria varia]TWT89454.1 hypothetical protein Pla52n_67930 [Stieleria varia]